MAKTILYKTIGSNIFEFLLDNENRIKNGSFVSFGYVNDHKFSIGPSTRNSHVNAESDKKLVELLDTMEDSAFKTKLIEWRASDKYQKAISGNAKTCPLDIHGKIVLVSRITCNWMDTEKLGQFYADKETERMRIRSKYGFGKNAEDYDETDWRRNPKYKGLGTREESSAVGMQGNQYKDDKSDAWLGGTGFYKNNEWQKDAKGKNLRGEDGQPIPVLDDHGNPVIKLAIRQHINKNVKSKPNIWFFVSDEGDMVELNYEFMTWFKATFAPDAVAKLAEIREDMSEEESAYLAEINDFQVKYGNDHENTFLISNMLFMTGTNEAGVSFVWKNAENIKGAYDYMDVDFLNKIIDDSVSDIKVVNEGVSTTSTKQSLNESKVNSIAKAISEVIAREISK